MNEHDREQIEEMRRRIRERDRKRREREAALAAEEEEEEVPAAPRPTEKPRRRSTVSYVSGPSMTAQDARRFNQGFVFPKEDDAPSAVAAERPEVRKGFSTSYATGGPESSGPDGEQATPGVGPVPTRSVGGTAMGRRAPGRVPPMTTTTTSIGSAGGAEAPGAPSGGVPQATIDRPGAGRDPKGRGRPGMSAAMARATRGRVPSAGGRGPSAGGAPAAAASGAAIARPPGGMEGGGWAAAVGRQRSKWEIPKPSTPQMMEHTSEDLQLFEEFMTGQVWHDDPELAEVVMPPEDEDDWMAKQPTPFTELHRETTRIAEIGANERMEVSTLLFGTRQFGKPNLGRQGLQAMGPVRHALAQRSACGTVEVHAPWADDLAANRETKNQKSTKKAAWKWRR